MAVVAPSFTVHTLDSSSPISSIEPVLSLSNQIFDTQSSSPTHHSSLEEWSIRLNNPNSILVYGSLNRPPPSSSVPIDSASADPTPRIIGFIFAHLKTESALPHPTLHIWLAGVSENARGTGVFAALMSKVESHARSVDIEGLSVATFPTRFGKMYAILQKQGWEARDWKEGGKKVLMMKPL
jgi:hypothetical protein